ncbi:MAG: polysaccharide biosynthesis/export family protein [Gemmatimonadetes bacterium]|nr:polysaccharide biosynthesis/export family protein [Gemmatimonadota bacterium]
MRDLAPRKCPVVHSLLLCALACTAASAQSADPVLRLQAGDQVQLLVKNEPALSGRYPVTPDGSTMLPLIGVIQVAGRPFSAVESEVRAAFTRELADPEFVITPLMRVSVLGEVRAPSMHWLDPAGTVADMLVLSGGLLPTANRKGITLRRNGEALPIEVDGSGAVPAIPVRSGDQLLIGRRSWLSDNLAIFVGAAATVAAAAVTTLIVR